MFLFSSLFASVLSKISFTKTVLYLVCASSLGWFSSTTTTSVFNFLLVPLRSFWDFISTFGDKEVICGFDLTFVPAAAAAGWSPWENLQRPPNLQLPLSHKWHGVDVKLLLLGIGRRRWGPEGGVSDCIDMAWMVWMKEAKARPHYYIIKAWIEGFVIFWRRASILHNQGWVWIRVEVYLGNKVQ